MLTTFLNLFHSKPSKTHCNSKVRWVAEAIQDPDLFRNRARSAASELGPRAMKTLVSLLHFEHTPPPDLEGQFPGLGQWISARQFAIFEMFYFMGTPALPTLRRTASGKYDWTQGNAIEILCRLAADGVECRQITAELKTLLPDVREEALLYAIGPLARQAKDNPTLNDLLSDLLTVPEFRESYEHLMSHDA